MLAGTYVRVPGGSLWLLLHKSASLHTLRASHDRKTRGRSEGRADPVNTHFSLRKLTLVVLLGGVSNVHAPPSSWDELERG